MGYYHYENLIEEYIWMVEGYDRLEFIPILLKYLEEGATVLELGMGSGKDLELLSEHFQVTGSDISHLFLKSYLENHPEADVEQVDAVQMDIKHNFDGIYSNIVLIHLTREELAKSLSRQVEVLNDGGILLHTFWYGDHEDVIKERILTIRGDC